MEDSFKLNESYKCLICPGICKTSCPVYYIKPRLTLTPQAIGRSIALYLNRKIDVTDMYNIWECLLCNLCMKMCPINVSVADMVLQLRFKYPIIHEDINIEYFTSSNEILFLISQYTDNDYINYIRNIIGRDLDVIQIGELVDAFLIGNKERLDKFIKNVDINKYNMIITDYPEIAYILKRFYDIDVSLDINIIYETIDLKEKKYNGKVVYFRPCYTYTRNIEDYTHKLLEMIGYDVIDARSHYYRLCCGGGLNLINELLANSIAKQTFNKLLKLGSMIVSNCPKCIYNLSKFGNVSHPISIIASYT